MHDGDNPQRPFVRCVCNQIFPDSDEPQRAQGKVGPPVALMGKWDQGANLPEKFFPEATCGKWAIGGDVFPNSGDVLRGKGMKSKTLLTIH